MGAVGFAMLGFFLFLATRLTGPDFALLYGDVSAEDSSQIIGHLESMGVPYKLSGTGGQILVPSDQVLRLRISMAEQGLPSGGSVGYEVFDQSAGLGTTNFVQNINLLRALEGELGRTIAALNSVHRARVHVVLPRREMFQRERTEPTASVFLRQRGGGRLPAHEISAIQHLVAAAVPGLGPERVTVVDRHGNLLASGTEDPSEFGAVAARSEEFRQQYEQQIKGTVEKLLERSVGVGNVRVEVAAEINFDRITLNEETYDPDGQVVRSTQTVEDSSSSTEADPNVTVGDNLPGTEAQGSSDIRNDSQRTEETVNFEISRTVRNHVQETGTVERLSVAVLVDGIYQQLDEDDDARTYQPRSEAELAQLATLVRSAIGFNEARGDTVEVVNMQFVSIEEVEDVTEPFLGLQKSDYFKIMEILVLAVVAILVILLVLRPIVSRVLAAIPTGREPDLEGVPGIPGAPGVQPMLIGPDGTPIRAPAVEGEAAAGIEPTEEEALIDINKVAGRVKASSVKKIAEIIDSHPDESLSILRGWMAESL
jgi:flagellar M-ring protein FliF